MPFKSEEQRRYMHANLPEIAQRWEQEYSNGGITSQGGMKNYLGEQPMVNAPKFWQSAPDHEMTELAYITPQERDVLVNMNMYGTMNGSPNEGPSGIMSLNGWGSKDPNQNVSGEQISAAESGGSGHGMSSKDASDFRSAAINAGAGQRVNPGFFDSSHVVSPAELAAAKAYRNQNTYAGNLAKGAWNQTRGSGLGSFISGGGFLGNIVRGVGQKFGLGKRYNQPTYDMSKFNNYGVGGSQNPTYYNDLENEYAGLDNLQLLDNYIGDLTKEEYDKALELSGIEKVDENVTDSYTTTNYLPAEFQDMAKFAKVTKQDLARYTPRNQKDLIDLQDWESALGTGTINKDMTKYEFEQMKKGNITQPGVYPKGYFEA